MSVDHYENFPVASWLCPPALRPPITAIYHFARTADDLADEGSASPEQRRALLQQLRASWHASLRGEPADPRWSAMLATLVREQQRHALPQPLLEDLLDAFRQDCGNPLYDSRAQLLDYCRRSANPIGRLLLHLYGLHDPLALRRSDAICTALQLINFWQDFSVDHPRGRCYLTAEDCARHGVDRAALLAGQVPGRAEAALLADLLDWTEGLMRQGAPLVHQLPGRMGWELRAVVQGGLRVLATIRRMNPHSFQTRPQLRGADWLAIGWAALRMRRSST
ncbi:squalene synthase HpnC [Ideonella sp. 4Y16]|uniref:Squalene synthase HpnC n=1 Tax=Ideonella alba TaxID=2824118 RepID=A0A940YC82_9BURK|nr:squalene synthase HpnC [Ideonella alba]MBQ0931990.1 squalene synthase HpnC [Ideonella alba]MBQ0942501.1 squalene synthase HpnC [Ideonella alba]